MDSLMHYSHIKRSVICFRTNHTKSSEISHHYTQSDNYKPAEENRKPNNSNLLFLNIYSYS
jgi:hypothetical protein